MSELGGNLWDSYLSLVSEVQQVTELIGAGLTVAVRLNHDVITFLLNFSSRIIHLLLLLLMKTREMVSLLKSDLLEFLADVGSGVHLLASALANLGTIVISADFQHVIRHAAILVSVILGLIFVLILCNYCGILQLLAAAVKCFLLVSSWTARAVQRLALSLARCTVIAVGDVVRCTAILIEVISRVSIILLEKVLDHFLDFVFLVFLIPSLLYKYLILRFRFCAYVQNKATKILQYSLRLLTRICATLYFNRIVYSLYGRILTLVTTMFDFLCRLLSNLRMRRFHVTPGRVHIASTSQVPPQVNYIYLEQQINSDAVNMDVNRLDAYLVARLNMDRHNDMVYHYLVRNNDDGSLYVTVKPVVRKVSFLASRFNRAQEILGIAAEVTPLVSKVTWNIDHNFLTGRKNRMETGRSCGTEGRGGGGNEDVSQMPECIVCQDRRRSVLLLPCRHLCLCQVCCSAILRSSNKLCPVCRHWIGKVHEVYV